MLPYLVLLGFVMFWISLEKKTINRKAFVIPFFTLVLFASIRNWTVGVDTGAYTFYFRYKTSPDNFEFNPYVEYGYQLLSYILIHITHNYFWLFLICSSIVVSINLSVIKKLSVDYWLSVLIFICFGGYTFFFNGLRQGIAMAIAIAAMPYLLKKNFKIYFLIIILAALFHKSALVMLILYWIVHLRLKFELKIIGVTLASFLMSRPVINYLATDNPKYKGYTQATEDAGGYLTYGLFVVIGIFCYIFGRNIAKKNLEYNLLEQFYLCSVFSLLPIVMLGTSPSGPQRIVFYYTWVIALLIPYIFKEIKAPLAKLIFIICTIAYFYLSTTRFGNLTPYTLNPIFKVI